jgi:soluble lytic murein transglycosylase-like protein
MKLAAVCLLLVCSGFVCDFKLLPKSTLVQPSCIVARLKTVVHRHPKMVDTHAMINAAARKHKVPAAVVKSIVAVESNFNCDAVSPSGAIGLMQLMPRTARAYGADPRVPAQNIDAGTRYLRVLFDRYRSRRNSLPLVIAAYNAGPAVVDRYEGVPPFPETQVYVNRVLELVRHFERYRS